MTTPNRFEWELEDVVFDDLVPVGKFRTLANPKTSPKELAGHHGHHAHGPSILWPAMYEHLRRKGYSKSKAARISNSAWNKKHAGMRTNTPTSARGIAKLRAASPWADAITYEH